MSADRSLPSPALRPALRLSRRAVPQCLALALLVAAAVPPAGAAAGPSALSERATGRALGHLVTVPGPADALDGHPAAAAWVRFREQHGLGVGTAARAFFDLRTAKPAAVELSLPWIPGAGNDLTATDVPGFDGDPATTLALLEERARALVDAHPDLFGVDSSELVLDRRASQGVGALRRADGGAGYRLWHLVFDWAPHGLKVEGARAVFRVNHGNLVQLGLENVGSAFDVPAADPSLLGEAEARAALAAHVGGLRTGDVFLADGELAVIATAPDTVVGYGPPVYTGTIGRGLDYRLVRRYRFARPGESEVWEGRVDALTGEVVAFHGTGIDSVVDGRVRPNGSLTSEVLRSFPHADYRQSPRLFADENGLFTSAVANRSFLAGRHVEIDDECGAIDFTTPPGDLHFGGAASPFSTDCNSVAGPTDGNTSAARTAYYWANEAFEVANDFMALDWSAGSTTGPLLLETNKPHAAECLGVYFEATHSIQFTPDSARCNNAGENVTHVLHEIGHAIDFTDGAHPGTDGGSGEAYGDIVAFLRTQDSCLARASAFSNGCGFVMNYTCTSCDGFREADWREHTGTTPHTPETNLSCQANCPGCQSWEGPCGRQPHCEIPPAAESVWDLVQELIARGYAINDAFAEVERLFYESRPSAGSMFTCAFATTTREGGAIAGSLYHSLRAADDCDGNPANGTPHAEAIFAALSLHEIAVGTVSDPANQDNDCSVTTIVVNSTGDGGDTDTGDGQCIATGGGCTLRAAIEQANASSGRQEIQFALTGGNTLQPASALPVVTDPVVIEGITQLPQGLVEIDGSLAGAGVHGLRISAGDSEVNGLVINRFSGDGIRLNAGGGNRVYMNRIGTDQAGEKDLGNGAAGIRVNNSANNQIGALRPGGGNLISDNLWGVRLSGAGTTGNTVFGNYIGTGMWGIGALGNGAHGILVNAGASGNAITDGVPHNVIIRDATANTIAHNGGDGIAIVDGVQNTVYGNRIRDNAGLGIDLANDGVTANDPDDVDTGPNGLQNFPVITEVTVGTSSTTIRGTLERGPFTLGLFLIDVYVSTHCDPSLHGEGARYLKPYTTFLPQQSGDWTIVFPELLGTGEQVTATATQAGSTSELSACFTVPTPPTQPPTPDK